MSPLWPSTIRVLLLADRVLAEYLSGGPRPRRQVVQQPFAGSEPAHLQAAMQSLLSALPVSRWQRIALYLADQHVHMMLLPQPPMALSTADKQAYALALLAQTYGDEARHWPLRMQDPRLPAATLLTAIPLLGQYQTLRLQSQALFGQQRWLSHTIQPYAGALLSHTRLPGDGTVVIAEHAVTRLLHVQHGQVAHVAGWSGDVRDTNSIADWLMRERMLLGGADSPCFWLAETTHRQAQAAGRALSDSLRGRLPLRMLAPSRVISALWQEIGREIADVA